MVRVRQRRRWHRRGVFRRRFHGCLSRGSLRQGDVFWDEKSRIVGLGVVRARHVDVVGRGVGGTGERRELDGVYVDEPRDAFERVLGWVRYYGARDDQRCEWVDVEISVHEGEHDAWNGDVHLGDEDVGVAGEALGVWDGERRRHRHHDGEFWDIDIDVDARRDAWCADGHGVGYFHAGRERDDDVEECVAGWVVVQVAHGGRVDWIAHFRHCAGAFTRARGSWRVVTSGHALHARAGHDRSLGGANFIGRASSEQDGRQPPRVHPDVASPGVVRRTSRDWAASHGHCRRRGHHRRQAHPGQAR